MPLMNETVYLIILQEHLEIKQTVKQTQAQMWQFSFETCQINKAEFSASRFLGSLVDDILGLSAPILPCFIRPSSLHSTLAQRQAKLTPAWAEPRGLWAM